MSNFHLNAKNNLYPELLGDIPRRGPHLVFFKYSRDPS
jgi:hypothetical protein